MANTPSKKERSRRLARVAPIIRGLLAEQTSDADLPYRPVILRSLADKKAVDFAEARGKAARCPVQQVDTLGPPLFLGAIDTARPPEEIRRELTDAISDHAGKFGAKPTVICIRGLGVLYLERRDRGRSADMPLRNKVAVVTGSAGAIGYGICKALLEKGCFLAATDLAGKKLDALAADLKEIGGDRVIGVPIDVTDGRCVTEGLETIVGTWGGIDILVANAGIAMVAHLKEMDLEAFRRLEKVNIEGTLLTLREAARLLIAQGTGGDIVIISTKNVPSPGAGFGAYSATKAASHQLGRIASIELAQHGIRVNMVAPDAVFSEGKYKSGLWAQIGPDRMRTRGLDEKGLQEYYRKRNLLKIQVTGRHVANAVLFLVTRQTPTTGATIPVDGGLPDATPR